MKDIACMNAFFNTKPTSPNWKANADVNNDGVCNMKDIAIFYFNLEEWSHYLAEARGFTPN
jgi:hypothetical protein